MRFRTPGTICALLGLAALQTGAAPLQGSFGAPAAQKGAAYREGYVLAKPRADHMGTVDAAEASEGLTIKKRFKRFGSLRVIKLRPGDSVEAAVKRLSATGRYEFVEPDYLRRALTTTPNDTSFSYQWALSNTGSNGPAPGVPGADIHATTAWNTINAAPNVIVAVLDTGVENTHSDLKGNLWINPNVNRDGYGDDLYGINVSSTNDGDGNTTDDDGHGTHVAGIIGAIGNNNLDTAGVAWKVQIMALKFLDSSGGSTDVGSEITCIDYAISAGANLINASFGSSTYSAGEYAAIQAAGAAHIIFVAAAGNFATDNDLVPFYPADYSLDNIVAVGASDDRDDTAVFTNYSSGLVDLFAPGVSIFSLYNNGPTATALLSGTSMSAPFVTGSLALLMAQFPTDSYRQLINRVLGSVDPNPNFIGRAQTGGRLDLAAAVTSTSNRPFNDAFTSRAHLAGPAVTVRSNNQGATLDPNEPLIGGATGGASLWWDWTAPLTGNVTIATTGSAYPTLVGVYTGSAISSLRPIASNGSAGAGVSSATFLAQAGTTYDITIDGQAGASGLTLASLAYANDAFASAATLSGNSVGITTTNIGATRESNEPMILGNSGGHSLWYAWTAPESGTFQISAQSTYFDPLLAIYTGASLASLSLVSSAMAPQMESSSGGVDPETFCICTFYATSGTTYYITVDNNSQADETTGMTTGPFTLTVADTLWQSAPAISDGIDCAPTVGADGTAYIGTDYGELYAVNAGGAITWTFDQAYGPFDSTSAALSSDGSVIYATTVEYATRTAAGTYTKGYVYAINTADGSLKWNHLLFNGPPCSGPVVGADGTIYIKEQGSTLDALNPADGTPAWTCAVPGSSPAAPVIGSDGTLYLGSDNGSFYAVSSGGAVKWTFTPANASSNPIDAAAAIDSGGNLYFGTLAGIFYAVNSSGQQIWSYQAGGSITSSAALDATGNLYFGCYDRNLYALATAGGALQWKCPLGGEVRGSSPAIDSNGVVYVGCLDNNVYAVTSLGAVSRVFATGGPVISSPVIFGTNLYFGSYDHRFYAFDIGASAAGSAWPMYLYNSRRDGRSVVDSLAITGQPLAALSATAGTPLELSVAAIGTGPLSFHWDLNGTPIPGATDSTLIVPVAIPGDAGLYTAVVTGPQGSVVSSAATVSVESAAPSFTLQPSPSSVTVDPGRSVAFNAIASGIPGPTYQWTLNGSTTIPGATSTTDPILLITGATAANIGTYACEATNSSGSVPSSSAALSVQSTGDPARLVNLSARADDLSGSNILIAGLSVGGSGAEPVLIRGVGPSLSGIPFNISDPLANPVITVFDHQNAPVVSDRGWGSAFTAGSSTVDVSPTAATTSLMTQVGAFTIPVGSLDSAMEIQIPAGNYTMELTDANGAPGVGLAEVYDAGDNASPTRLANISARADVGAGGNILIGGLVISGGSAETVLLRAVGPGLVNQGLAANSGLLPQPTLAVYDGGTQIYSNTGWGSDPVIQSVFSVVGATDLETADSAVLLTLPAGAYTVLVQGVGGTSGVGLVEVFEIY